MDFERPELERVIVTGVVRTVAPLRIGSGLGVLPATDDTASHMPLMRDGAGHPMIPASTLRGWLRRRCPGDEARVERLFGSPRRAAIRAAALDDEGFGRAGAVRVYDARWLPGPDGPRVQPARIAIDPVTGTAREGALFSEEAVPAGACFTCRMEIDRIDRADLDAFLDTLRGWDGGPDSALGAGKTRMQGRLHWEPASERVLAMTYEAWRAWLLEDDLGDLDARFEPYTSATTAQARAAPRSGLVVLGGFSIVPESPLLVDSEKVRDGDHTDRRFPRAGDATWLRETSLRGAIRGRARRILLTKISAAWPDGPDSARRDLADAMLARVLGGAESASALRVGRAEAAFTKDDIHRRTFVAIDRFTGAAADRKLYSVEAVAPEAYRWPLALDAALLPEGEPWRRGLLVYLLRDAMDGELRLGWGKARGFGCIRVVLSHGGQCFMDWARVARELAAESGENPFPWTAAEVRGWLEDLDHEIARRIAAADPVLQRDAVEEGA